jgi:hypothetical protein
MKFLESMILYFQGEKLEALIFILPLGLLCMIFGGWLLSEGQQGFAKGIAGNNLASLENKLIN